MARRPYMKFYTGDWMSDVALKSCSLAARGLWIDMLCLMSQGEPRGYLGVKGGDNLLVNLEDKLVVYVGVNPDELKPLLEELGRLDVFSRTEDGVIYSRRMVRDEEVHQKRVRDGKSGGNPALVSDGRLSIPLTSTDSAVVKPHSHSHSQSHKSEGGSSGFW